MKVYLSTILGICCLLWMACDRTPVEPEPEPGRSFLHIYNAYSGVSAVDGYLTSFESNPIVAEDMRFGDSWPNSSYASLLTDPALVPDSADLGGVYLRLLDHTNGSDIVPNELLTLSKDNHFTIILVSQQGKPILVKTVDNFIEMGDSLASLRFSNLNESIVSVSLQSNDDQVKVSNLNFLNYSSYEPVKPGVYSLSMINDANGDQLHRFDNFELKAGRSYSFYLVDLSGVPQGDVEVFQ